MFTTKSLFNSLISSLKHCLPLLQFKPHHCSTLNLFPSTLKRPNAIAAASHRPSEAPRKISSQMVLLPLFSLSLITFINIIVSVVKSYELTRPAVVCGVREKRRLMKDNCFGLFTATRRRLKAAKNGSKLYADFKRFIHEKKLRAA